MNNLAIVRQVYEAFARRDMQAVLAHLARIGHEAEEIEALEPRLFLTSTVAVAIVGHLKCRAKRTGRSYESDFVHVVWLRDGMITRFQEFFDTYTAGEAFRVAGA